MAETEKRIIEGMEKGQDIEEIINTKVINKEASYENNENAYDVTSVMYKLIISIFLSLSAALISYVVYVCLFSSVLMLILTVLSVSVSFLSAVLIFINFKRNRKQ